MSFNKWKKYRLGDFVEIQNGYAFKAEDFAELGIPVIKIKNLTPPNVNFEDVQYFNATITDRLKQFIIKKKDILISMTGSHINQIASAVGKVSRYQFESPALLNQRVGKVYVKDNNIASEDYLFYFLSRFETQFELASSAGGSANQANISPFQIKSLEIDLPDLSSQQYIAHILSSFDEKIENNLVTNQTLEEIARTLFKEWFVNFNYPGANGKLKHSEMGEIPENWDVGFLGDIYNTTSGGTPSRSKPEYFENGSIGWVKSKELNNSFIIDTEEKITPDALKNSSAKSLPKYSVLIAMYGATVGEIGIITDEFACNQAICAFLPNELYPFSFIYNFLLNSKQDIISRAVGSAQQNISQQLLLQYKLFIPPSELVQEYHRIVLPMFLKIQDNIEENKSLKDLRDSILPKLMSGEIIANPSTAQ